ncbi:hypothetical protein KIW84_046111 [Lathyrus oleraceus]|uniref:Uncharacterized protein n=1 Tax=Pisum sativum TaxID=3888 RepID=A0A9D5AY63_PEA|nr:hypothetical protein KIW84_046111 [Pisum sativum]
MERIWWRKKSKREGIRIVENKLGDYDCPEFVLSALEERSIAKPWEQGFKELGGQKRWTEVQKELQLAKGNGISGKDDIVNVGTQNMGYLFMALNDYDNNGDVDENI